MDEQISALRRQIGRVPLDVRGRRRYGTALRKELIELARSWRAGGGSPRELAARLRVSEQTVATWLYAPGAKAKRRASSIKKVAVAEPAPSAKKDSPLVVITPAGLRIEGLDLLSAIFAARELG